MLILSMAAVPSGLLDISFLHNVYPMDRKVNAKNMPIFISTTFYRNNLCKLTQDAV